MGLPWRSRFIYSTADWETELPVRAWTRRRGTTAGGSRTAASGVPAGYVVRTDRYRVVTLRFYEHEWAAIDAMLAWSEIGEPVTWYPDADDTALSFSVYIDSPKAGEEFETPRNNDDGAGIVHEITLVLRIVTGDFTGLAEYFNYNE